MKRKYIALAFAGLVGCAALIQAGVIDVGVTNPYGVVTLGGDDDSTGTSSVDETDVADGPASRSWHSNNMWMKNRAMHMGGNRGIQRCGPGTQHCYTQPHRDMTQGLAFARENYLNLSRLEGTLSYNNGTDTYLIDNTVLYLGNEWFLNTLAKSDYDGDGIYEYIWAELEGLIGSELIVNGVLEGDILYVSHVKGIWLTMPREINISELEGILESINGSYFIEDTKLIVAKRGVSRSDIDKDGALEPIGEELYGLLGENILVDGTTIEGGMVVIHINGIWAR